MLVNFIVVIAAFGYFALVVIGFLSDDGKANANSSDDGFFDGLDDDGRNYYDQHRQRERDEEARYKKDLETMEWSGRK